MRQHGHGLGALAQQRAMAEASGMAVHRTQGTPLGPLGLANAPGTAALDALGAQGLDDCGPAADNCTAAVVEEAAGDEPAWLEEEAFPGLPGVKVWHVMFMVAGAVCALAVVFCCCIRFRIPRTKQEIEADYVRKQITRKFQKQLRRIQNADMDDMDLKRALDRVRAEFKSDTESLAQSISSSANASVCNSPGGPRGDTYRKGSDIGVSIEDLIERRNSGLGARFSSLVGTLGRLRPRRGSSAVASAGAAEQQAPSNHRTMQAEP